MASNEITMIIKVQSEMKKQMEENTKAVEKMQKQTEKSTKKMEKSFRSVGGAIQAAMGSAILVGGANLIKQQEKLSLSMQVLKVKSEDVYNQLQNTGQATFGLADKFDMVNAANKAMSFGIDLSNGRLEKLMKLAAKTSVVMGTDVKSAFDDLVTGVSRESKMILDNLGVMVNLNDIYSKYASELGITAKELTKAQRQTALLDEVNVKLAESTALVTDEMVNQAMQGTQALKTFETASVTALNFLVVKYVELGETIGETAAKTLNFVDKMEKDVKDRIFRAKHGLTFTWKQFGLDMQKIARDNDVQKEMIFTEADAGNVVKKSKKGLRKLKRDAQKVAKMIFTEEEVQEAFDPFGLQNVNKEGNDGFDEWFKKEEAYEQEMQSLALDFNESMNELNAQNRDRASALRLQDQERERAQTEKHFNMMKSFGSEYLNAIITGNADAIPQILAQQAMMFGQQIFWDGLKTMWFGISDNTIFPGLGANKYAVGIAEMGIGAGLMAGGGAASNAMGSTPSNAGDSGANERNVASQGSQDYNINVVTSLYGSKTQAKRELNATMN
jgi:hypothetical protein